MLLSSGVVFLGENIHDRWRIADQNSFFQDEHSNDLRKCVTEFGSVLVQQARLLARFCRRSEKKKF